MRPQVVHKGRGLIWGLLTIALMAGLVASPQPVSAQDQGDVALAWIEAIFKDNDIQGSLEALGADASDPAGQERLRTTVGTMRARMLATVPTECFMEQYLAYWDFLLILDLVIDLNVAGDPAGATTVLGRANGLVGTATNINLFEDCFAS